MKSKDQYKKEFQLTLDKSDDKTAEENILHDFAREASVIDAVLRGGKVSLKEAKERMKGGYKVWKNSLKNNNHM